MVKNDYSKLQFIDNGFPVTTDASLNNVKNSCTLLFRRFKQTLYI